MSYNCGPKIVTEGIAFYVDASNGRSNPHNNISYSLVSNATGMLTGNSSDQMTYYSFDGTAGTRINYGKVGFELFGSSDFSIMICVRYSDIPLITSGMIVSKGGSSSNGFALYISTLGKISFTILYEESSVECISDNDLSDNLWHFVICRRKSGAMEMFVDGKKQISTSYAIDDISSNLSFTIGEEDEGLSFINPGEFDIALCAFYNKALSDLEVYRNYDSLKGRFGL